MSASSQAHVAVASINQTVGDWRGNVARIREVVDAARDRGVRLLLLPEMCIPGYSLGDRLLRVGTLERSWHALEAITEHTAGIVVAVGLPILFEGVVFNAMALVADRRIVGLVAKENLATGDVEYENRYYQPWPHGRVASYVHGDVEIPLGTQLFEIPGVGVMGFEICEDSWKGIRPGSTFVLSGAEILCNPSASWFTIGKHAVRRRMVQQISLEDHCVYLYASLLGCDATRLVFDGSTFVASNGEVLSEGDRFVFTRDWDLRDAVVDLDEIRHKRMEEGSWREQHARMAAGQYGAPPPVVRVEGNFATDAVPAPPRRYWEPMPQAHPDPSLIHHESAGFRGRTLVPADLSHAEMELALALALRDYVRKTGIRNLCLALSGGRDSAMVALLVHRMFVHDAPELAPEALHAEIATRFTCAYLATENSGDATRNAARAVAADVGARFHDGAIQRALDACEDTVASMIGEAMSWDRPEHDIPLQNIQARLRGTLIWTLANLERALLLVTSNKSEAAVGYTTMDGDSSGGLAPIADVPKSLVGMWLRWAHEFHGYEALRHILQLEATAELRPPDEAQTDESDLMPFAVLDQLMYAFVQLGLEPADILPRLWPAVREHYPNGDGAAGVRAFAAHIRKFVRLLCFAQWKRERFAISFRITAFDLDPKTGFRFPPVQSPFVEELEELDALVEAIAAGDIQLADPWQA